MPSTIVPTTSLQSVSFLFADIPTRVIAGQSLTLAIWQMQHYAALEPALLAICLAPLHSPALQNL